MIPSFSITDAFCNHTKNPVGIEERPCFSWRMKSTARGDVQTAYQIVMKKASRADAPSGETVWDSGIVSGEENIQIPVGEAVVFLPKTRYQWQVTAWNRAGKAAQSEPQYFETGKLNEPWTAHWIGAAHVKNDASSHGAPYLRRAVTVDRKLRRATLSICGVGYYEAYVEGQKVSDALLEPAYTKYDATLYYSSYDVTGLITGSQFAVGILLGNGWYNYFEADEWNSKQAPWRSFPKVIAELYLEYDDNTAETIPTDSRWRSAPSPITYNCVRNGEFYDARLVQANWNCFQFDDNAWDNAVLVRSPGGILTANTVEPIKITRSIPAQAFWKTDRGTWIFDFGQNMAGIVELKIREKSGTEITVRHSEAITEDRQDLKTDFLSGFVKSGLFQTAKYTAGGLGEEIWSPQFTYYGFRYAEISGALETVDAETLTAKVMHTSFQRRGHFTCSDRRINQISQMCHWSSISNLFGVPTDCPHREKNPWTGDASLVSEQVLLNYDAVRFYKKWFRDLCDSQRPNGMIPCIVPSTGWGYHWGNGPDWSKAMSEIPWNLYLYTGDLSILKQAYPAVKKHFYAMAEMSRNWVVDYGIGDWCAPFEGAALAVNMGSFRAPRAFTDTACFYYSARVLDKMEALLGYDREFQPICQAVKKALKDQFVLSDPPRVKGDCQTSYGFALYYDLFPEEETGAALDALVEKFAEKDFHPDYGLLGSKCVLHSLGNLGKAEVIYQSLSCTGYPSYQHWIDLGRTTLGECWNGAGSQNHYMFSDVSAVFYRYFAGLLVDEDHAGFRKFTLKPQLLDTLESVDCAFETPHGTVSIQWEKQGAAVALALEIPFGTQAELTLPQGFVAQEELPGVLGSGTYQFTLERREQNRR